MAAKQTKEEVDVLGWQRTEVMLTVVAVVLFETREARLTVNDFLLLIRDLFQPMKMRQKKCKISRPIIQDISRPTH